MHFGYANKTKQNGMAYDNFLQASMFWKLNTSFCDINILKPS